MSSAHFYRSMELRPLATCDEVARDEVSATGVDEQRLLVVRLWCRPLLERTARPEPAARRRLERAREVALEHDSPTRTLNDGVRHCGGRQERLRVRMLRVRKQLRRRR